MSKDIKEIAKIAATWWADKVAAPKFDNGDNSQSGGFAMMLANLSTKDVGMESRDKFISDLINKIEQKLSNDGTNERWMPNIILGVDYGPCRELKEAAEYAGISSMNFPWKTTMWVDKNHVSVRYGYGASEIYLYVNKAYWKSKIESYKSSIEEYRNGSMLTWIKDEEERKATAKERITDIEKDIIEYQSNFDNAED